MDSSWQIHWQGVSMIIDPWLTGSEIDGFSWLNEQWHITEPLPMADIGRCDLIVVSQPYTDHCHAATLDALKPIGAMMAVRPAKKRIERETGNKNITEIPDAADGWAPHGELLIAKISPDKWIDPIYHALVIRCGQEAIFYAPHGFLLSEAQMKILQPLRVRLLITTFSYFRIPAIMGGLVNPGVDAAKKLAEQINAEKMINTHDEQKKGRGLVTRLAKSVYADMNAESQRDDRVVAIENYDYLIFKIAKPPRFHQTALYFFRLPDFMTCLLCVFSYIFTKRF